MNKKDLKFSIDDIELYKDDDNVDFAYVKLWALADGNNSHHLPISTEVLKQCGDSILGKYIIAKFENWKGDVTTHVNDQKIVGNIDARQQVQYEEKDGKTWITVTGMLSKLYATDVVQMFRNGQNQRWVSCEFSVQEGEEDDNGDTPILAFDIHGVTILGLDYRPSCEGAEIKVIQFAEQTKKSSIEQFAEKRKQELADEKYTANHKLNKSKDAVDMGEWDGAKAIDDLVKEKNFATLAKSVCLKLEDGWQDRTKGALKYPVMNIKNGEWVYNAKGLSSAEGYGAQHDPEVAKKAKAIKDKLGLDSDKEEKMSKKQEDDDVIMGKDNKDPKDTKDKEQEKMGCGDKEKMGDCSDNSQDDNDGDEEKMAKAKKDPKVKDDGKDSKDNKDNNKDEKFSLSRFADKTKAEEKFADDLPILNELFSMSADEVVEKYVSMAKENKAMKDEKQKQMEDKRDKKLFAMLNEANIKDASIVFELTKEGKSLSFEKLDGEFSNKIKSFASESTVDNFMRFAGVDMIQNNNEEKDVFERIANK